MRGVGSCRSHRREGGVLGHGSRRFRLGGCQETRWKYVIRAPRRRKLANCDSLVRAVCDWNCWVRYRAEHVLEVLITDLSAAPASVANSAPRSPTS